MKYTLLFALVFVLATAACAQTLLKKKLQKGKYEEVDFEDLMHRYFEKDKIDGLEGIYSVSAVITKKSKKLFSREEKFRVVARKDNYARVAILRDRPSSKRDYIEVSLSYHDAKTYPIMGELNTVGEGSYIYRHFEPDQSQINFSMVMESDELLEAEFSDMHKRKTITYKLSYLKLYPKAADLTVYRD